MTRTFTSEMMPTSATTTERPAFLYLLGVDGGGTGTRVILADALGQELARASAGPSGSMHGIPAAWQAILTAVDAAFAEAFLMRPNLDQIAIACGLAGVHNRAWAEEFSLANPGFGGLVLETDARTTLLGAHQGRAGAIIALGTGSIAEALLPDGSCREAGGWGFPSSDEASGAWMGLRAMNHTQQAVDGRVPDDALARDVVAFCGGSRDAMFVWLAGANQTRFAQLAPFVIAHAQTNSVARGIMLSAGVEVQKMVNALDSVGTMPIALCGGLADAVLPFLPEEVQQRVSKPIGDSVAGALYLVKKNFMKTVA